MKPLKKTFYLGVLLELVLAAGFGREKEPWIICKAEQTGARVPRAVGIAARYPGDRGISEDPAVVFSDDFEAWTQGGTQPSEAGWNVRKNETSRTKVVPLGKAGKSKTGLSGNAFEIACWTTGSGSQTGGLSLKLGNYNHANEGLGDGYDELFIRYYIMFDENYRAVRNHGANLGGRDVTRKDAAWVGMAGIRDVSTRGYFYSGVQPRGKAGSEELEMGFYSYHLDKKGPWGENYEVKKKIPVRVGRWYCVERHLKLNSVDLNMADPANADGLEELWIDGQLTIRKEGVRFRRVPHLRITFFSLETYYHGLPKEYNRDRPIKVYFDNVVIARKYVGPMRGVTSKPGPGSQAPKDAEHSSVRQPASPNKRLMRIGTAQPKRRLIDYRLKAGPKVLAAVDNSLDELEQLVGRAGAPKWGDALALPEDTLGLGNWEAGNPNILGTVLPEAVQHMLKRLG